MDFSLTGEQTGFQEHVRSLAQAVCSPGAADRDAAGTFPREALKRLAAERLLGLRVPQAWGGSGRDALSAVLAIAAVSEADASVGLLLGFHNVVCDALLRSGSEKLQAGHMLPLASGTRLAALALYHPQVAGEGVDPATVSPDAEGWRIEGEKPLVPGAREADVLLVYARAVGGGATRARVLLLVPRSTPGIMIEEPSRIFGVRASGACRVIFRSCRVPPESRLFAEPESRAAARALLSAADLVVAAQAVGIASAALEKARRRAHETGAGGEAIGSRQSVQWKLADMGTALEASRLFLMRAASALERGERYDYEAAQAKAFAGRAAVQVAEKAMLIAGASGAITDFGVERHWRDAMTTEMNPSTRDETLLAVARVLLEEAP